MLSLENSMPGLCRRFSTLGLLRVSLSIGSSLPNMLALMRSSGVVLDECGVVLRGVK